MLHVPIADEMPLRETIRRTLRMDCSVDMSLDHHHILFVDSFPRSDSGKVIRHRLPPPEIRPRSAIRTTRFLNEADVLCAFRDVLGSEMLEPTDDFFHSGGDSIALAEVADLLQIDPLLVQAYPTARKLVASLRGASNTSVDAEVPDRPSTHVTFIRDGRHSYLLTAISEQGNISQEAIEDEDQEMLSRKRQKSTPKERDAQKQGITYAIHDLQPCETSVRAPEVSLKKNLQEWKTQDSCSRPHCRIIHPYHTCRNVTPSGQLSEPLSSAPAAIVSDDPVLSMKWSGKMCECVDGPLTVLYFSIHPSPRSTPSEMPPFAVVLASCHGGGVACFDERTGYRHWLTRVEGCPSFHCKTTQQYLVGFVGRAALGVMVSRDLDVWIPSSDACVHVLALEDGVQKTQIRLSSPIRTSLVMDPWTGALWAALDDSTLTVFLNVGEHLR